MQSASNRMAAAPTARASVASRTWNGPAPMSSWPGVRMSVESTLSAPYRSRRAGTSSEPIWPPAPVTRILGTLKKVVVREKRHDWIVSVRTTSATLGWGHHADTDRCDAAFHDPELPRGAVREIDDTPVGSGEGSAIVDAHDHPGAGVEGRDLDEGVERKGPMSRRQAEHVEGFPGGGRPAVELVAVPGGLAPLVVGVRRELHGVGL